MGWKQAFDYTRSIAARQGLTGSEKGSDRVDAALPLGARIGSLLQLQVSPVIRAQAAGSLIAMPASGDTRVTAISQLRIEPDTAMTRLYLVTGDAADDEKFLQLFVGEDGGIAEVLYCTQLARVIPETADDQDAYTGVAGRGLGDASYTLWRDQLAGMLEAAQLAAVFGEGDSLVYRRDAGGPEAAFVVPFTGQEVRIDDAQGRTGLKQQIYFMPYVRELAGGGREYLLITTEIIESVNGDSGKRGIHVDFVIAIPVEQERITVQ
jgi:hypothetical protein